MNPGTFGGKMPNPLEELLEANGWKLPDHGYTYDPMTGWSWAELRATRDDHTPEDLFIDLLQLGGWCCRKLDFSGIIIYLP